MYVKLPNNNVVLVDANNFISVLVSIDLNKFIDNDLDRVLDILSEEATGSPLLSNISYEIVSATGTTLALRVSGDIESLEAEEVPESDLPLVNWAVQICRTGFGFNEVKVKARTEAEAIDSADDIAGNLSYSEKSSEYSFNAQRA